MTATWKSSGGDARMMPVRPPKRNVVRKPIAHSIGVSNDMAPPHIVPIQLKNFTPVPTGVKFFNWIGTMWGGAISFDTPMLWSIGFLTTFLFGGLTGIILASPPLDFQVTDTYFVVAHFHYVLFGTVVFATFAGFYFWWPKLTGRMLNETWGKIHFWILFVGFHSTFLVQHWLGVEGMLRRIADSLPTEGFTFLNQVSP